MIDVFSMEQCSATQWLTELMKNAKQSLKDNLNNRMIDTKWMLIKEQKAVTLSFHEHGDPCNNWSRPLSSHFMAGL